MTRRTRTFLLLSLCAVAFVCLRMRWVGHLLTWDEGMNLCSIRSFMSEGTDVFSFWFWRHPPLMFFLSLPLGPLRGGFAERFELLAIATGLGTLLLLFFLNRRVFGERVALWSCFLLAAMPSSMFYDVWLKRDAPVAALGLGALLLVMHRRPLLAGACLGCALLAKETAVFYLGAVLLLLLLTDDRARWRHALGMLAAAMAVSGWWYFGVKSSVDGVVTVAVDAGGAVGLFDRLMGGFAKHLDFASGSDAWAANWQGRWDYYLVRLPHDLGWTTAVFAAAGAVFLVCRNHLPLGGRTGESARAMRWPLLLLVPAMVLLSALPSKVPWVTMSLYPAWATVAAVGIVELLGRVRRLKRAASDGVQSPARLLGLGLAALVVINAVAMDYDQMLLRDGSRQQVAARNSRQIANMLNGIVSDEDRVLLTSFYYWQGPAPGYICPVFTAYLETRPAMLVRSHLLSFEAYLADVKAHDIDWLVLSPPPGPGADLLFRQFSALGLSPCRLSGAFIYDTRSLRE